MARDQRLNSGARRFAPADALPPSRTVAVRALDGTRLHAEVFGPEDGYPIVLAHASPAPSGYGRTRSPTSPGTTG